MSPRPATARPATARPAPARPASVRSGQVRLPPPDHHRDVSGGPLRPALFGAMDGLVSNTSLVAGLAGSGAASHTVALTGLAGLLAGAFSMAVGEWTSVGAQAETARAEVQMESLELARSPESEQAELALAYEGRGLDPDLARQVAAALSRDPDTALRAHTLEELGVDVDRMPDPWQAAGASMAAFSAGALVPALPYFLGAHTLWLALVLAGVGLFGCGAVVSRFTRRRTVWSGCRQLLLGAGAAGLTFLIGHLVGSSLG